MTIKTKTIISVFLFGLAWTAVNADRVRAQQNQSGAESVFIQETIPEAFDRAYSTHSKPYLQDRSLGGQFNSFFGLFSLPEREIARDAELINILYRDTLMQQGRNTPPIRTPDLNSPFDSSVMTLPASSLE